MQNNPIVGTWIEQTSTSFTSLVQYDFGADGKYSYTAIFDNSPLLKIEIRERGRYTLRVDVLLLQPEEKRYEKNGVEMLDELKVQSFLWSIGPDSTRPESKLTLRSGENSRLFRQEGALSQQQQRRSPKRMTTPDAAKVRDAVREFARTGQYPGGADRLQRDVAALVTSGEADEVMAMLEAMGANEGGSKILDIRDHYRPGEGLYELRWPVAVPLSLPFHRLDRPTQFSVLFGDWSRREMEGTYALVNGDIVGAQAIFEECLARAQQIEVPELMARSHEGLARVASNTNQRSQEREHLKLAAAARGSA